MESLSDKLKSLGVDLGMKKVGKPAKIEKKAREKIEAFVQGEELLTVHGPTFVVKSEYPLEDSWGDFPMYEAADHTTLLQCAKLNPEVSEPLSKMIFMDTETTGLDWTRDKCIGLSFCFDGKTGYYIQADLLSGIAPLMGDPLVAKCAHNAKFDLHFLRAAGITVPAGYSYGLPVGITFIGGAFSEPTLIRLAYAFEQATQARRVPKFRRWAEW